MTAGTARAVAPTPLRRLALPTLLTLVMLAVLIALGTWQVRRLAWKQGILAQIDRAEASPAVPLPADPAPFTKVRVTGTLRHDLSATFGVQVRDTPTGPDMGGDLIEPLERPGADPLLVDRGWVPSQPRTPVDQPDGPVTVEGFVRERETPTWLSPKDDTAGRHFYSLDPVAIGDALGLPHVAPYTLIALGTSTLGRYPQPAQTLPRPPNNHLAYAITWYGLAMVLAAIYATWAARTLRDPQPDRGAAA